MARYKSTAPAVIIGAGRCMPKYINFLESIIMFGGVVARAASSATEVPKKGRECCIEPRLNFRLYRLQLDWPLQLRDF